MDPEGGAKPALLALVDQVLATARGIVEGLAARFGWPQDESLPPEFGPATDEPEQLEFDLWCDSQVDDERLIIPREREPIGFALDEAVDVTWRFQERRCAERRVQNLGPANRERRAELRRQADRLLTT